MAERPVFMPSLSGPLLVHTRNVQFEWFAGLSKSQAQKAIESLHAAARHTLGVERILEISSKSKAAHGVSLSAFNLTIATPRRSYSVECAFQASKVFERGGPFLDLLNGRSIDAKRDPRLTEHGRLIKFRFYGVDWPLQPSTAFYDWLYINALHRHPELAGEVLRFSAFSDIAFNPERSINCQARAAALYVSLHERGLLSEMLLKDQATYMRIVSPGDADASGGKAQEQQPSLFGR
jgi:hypothetical protein